MFRKLDSYYEKQFLAFEPVYLRAFLSKQRRRNVLMKPLEAREGNEENKDSNLTVRQIWQIKQLYISEGRAVTTPSLQNFFQEYQLVSMQSGIAVHCEYRNTRISNQAVDGALLIVEPGEAWTSEAKDLTFYSLSIDPAWLQQIATELLHREKPLPHFPSHLLFDPPLSQAVHDLAVRSLAPASRLQQEELLLHLLAPLLLSHAEYAKALPQMGWEHPAIKRTKEYLQEHYAEDVSLQELAAVVNLSPFHLARVFRQEVGLSPHVYQTKLRLARAKTLLRHGYDVGYVAHETGFFDQSHFTQQFKRHHLVTPGSYRKYAR